MVQESAFPTITNIHAIQILDSRGNPTVQVSVTAGGFTEKACVPSGASTGSHEAVELRDGRRAYQGKSVLKAVRHVNDTIKKHLLGENVLNQHKIDRTLILLDKTKNKAHLGANAILGVSLACARCAAKTQNKQLYEYLRTLLPEQYHTKKAILPVPFANVINGGRHAQNNLSIQEFLLAPVGAGSFSEGTQMVAETYHVLKKLISEKYGKLSANVGDEGGFAPNVQSVEEALDLLVLAIKEAGYTRQVKIALDCAASEYYKNGLYTVDGKQYTPDGLAAYYGTLLTTYPIISIEDPFAEDDYVAFMHFMEGPGKKLPVIGDDLLCTNMERLRMAAQRNLCNGLLLKVNQIGTLSEAMDAAIFAQFRKMHVMVSHRSGETEDAFIADLAVALGCGQIKLGAPCRGERTAKYNRLLEIEDAAPSSYGVRSS